MKGQKKSDKASFPVEPVLLKLMPGCTGAACSPPKGTNLAKMIHRIEFLEDKGNTLNVTDHQSNVTRVLPRRC